MNILDVAISECRTTWPFPSSQHIFTIKYTQASEHIDKHSFEPSKFANLPRLQFQQVNVKIFLFTHYFLKTKSFGSR